MFYRHRGMYIVFQVIVVRIQNAGSLPVSGCRVYMLFECNAENWWVQNTLNVILAFPPLSKNEFMSGAAWPIWLPICILVLVEHTLYPSFLYSRRTWYFSMRELGYFGMKSVHSSWFEEWISVIKDCRTIFKIPDTILDVCWKKWDNSSFCEIGENWKYRHWPCGSWNFPFYLSISSENCRIWWVMKERLDIQP